MKMFALSLIILVLAACATPGQVDRSSATISSLQGTAEVSSVGGETSAASVGRKIYAGMTVQTDADSSVDFNLGQDGGVLRLHPNSTLTFERIGASATDPDAVAVLNLSRGRVTGDTLKLPDQRKIVVKTPAGMHEIR